jgi:CHASE3 domain sensor protein
MSTRAVPSDTLATNLSLGRIRVSNQCECVFRNCLKVELSSAEDTKLVGLICGLVVVIACLSIGVHHEFKRILAQVSDALVGSLVIVEHVDNIVNQLDRLTTNERAFLSTGDDRCSQRVGESIMGINLNLEYLEVAATKDRRLSAAVNKLSQSINIVMDSMGQLFQVQKMAGAAVAIAYLDDDISVDCAKDYAAQLRRLATECLFVRVRGESW